MTMADMATLDAVLEESPIGVSISRRSDGVIVFANATFVGLLQVGKPDFIGTRAADWYVDDDQRSTVVRHIKRYGRVDNAEVQFRKADGTPFWTLLTIRPSVFHGEQVNLAWIYDITERKAAEDRLQLAAKVVETANEGILITNADGVIEAVNGAFCRITGYAPDEAIGRKPSFLRSNRHDSDFYQAMWKAISETGQWQGEIWNRRKSGEVYVEWLSIAAVRDAGGRVSHMLGIFADITSRKEDEQQVWRQANYDALTGLPNRSLFLDRLTQTVKAARRDRTRFALLFVDLDGFKAVNDAFGHAAGDLLLQEAAARLSAGIRSSDTVARLSGDEFTVILQHVQGRDDVATVGAKMVARLGEPFDLDGQTAAVRASIGIAMFPEDADDAATLIKLADQAMYAVKRAGKNNFGFHQSGQRLVLPLE
ncbi:MAG: diguanylate cyclase domain-containing protein [Actinomycetota bacterium]